MYPWFSVLTDFEYRCWIDSGTTSKSKSDLILLPNPFKDQGQSFAVLVVVKILPLKGKRMINSEEDKKIRAAMREVINFFGSYKAVADILDISPETVRKWGTHFSSIPLKHAYRIDELTDGKVKIADLIPAYPVKRLPRKK